MSKELAKLSAHSSKIRTVNLVIVKHVLEIRADNINVLVYEYSIALLDKLSFGLRIKILLHSSFFLI